MNGYRLCHPCGSFKRETRWILGMKGTMLYTVLECGTSGGGWAVATEEFFGPLLIMLLC
jgi:hypothetical protein